MAEVPECLQCGACCFSKLEAYVRVTGADHARLGIRGAELVNFDGHRAHMRMVDNHCAALVLGAATGRHLCDIYETRPQICRDLLRGSSACLGELDAKRERPLLALGRSSVA